MDKFQEAICAFANDLPNSRKNGYLILRAYDDGGNVGGKNGGDNVPSLSQVLSQVLSQACPKLDVSHYPDATAILIALCKEPQSLKELMEKTKEKNRGRIKNNVLQHLCESGLVEPTIKDVPNSPKQKYTLTDNGREKLQTQYNGNIFRYSNAPLSEEELAAARENYAYRETSKVTS